MAYQIIHLRRKQGFVVRKVGDAHMVIPTGPRMKEYKGVITINETGAFLFDLVKEEKKIGELMQALIDEYGIDEPTAYDAVAAFAHQCNEANLLVVDEVEKLPEGKTYLMTEETAEAVKQDMDQNQVNEETSDGQNTEPNGESNES